MFHLHREWTLYFHAKNQGKKYADNKEKLIDISDIKTFWGTINNIPTPCQMFSDGSKNTKMLKRTGQIPNAYSFFKKGIDPCWEDPKNVNGGEWSIRKFKDVSPTDDLWLNLLINLIGETFDKSENINGVRVVDCTRDTQVMYRIEIWYDSLNDKAFFEKKIKEICELPNHTKLLFRDHSTVKETK
jgi:hypothetical protein